MSRQRNLGIIIMTFLKLGHKWFSNIEYVGDMNISRLPLLENPGALS